MLIVSWVQDIKIEVRLPSGSEICSLTTLTCNFLKTLFVDPWDDRFTFFWRFWSFSKMNCTSATELTRSLEFTFFTNGSNEIIKVPPDYKNMRLAYVYANRKEWWQMLRCYMYINGAKYTFFIQSPLSLSLFMREFRTFFQHVTYEPHPMG